MKMIGEHAGKRACEREARNPQILNIQAKLQMLSTLHFIGWALHNSPGYFYRYKSNTTGLKQT